MLSVELSSVLLFVVVFLLTCVFLRLTSRRGGGSDERRPPSLPSLPFIGSILSLPPFEQVHVWFLNTVRPKYGSVVAFYLGSQYEPHVNS